MPNSLYDALFGQHISSTARFLLTDAGTTVTYADFIARAGQMAAALDHLGVGMGERVALQLRKSVDALALCAACIQRGVIFLPLNPAYTAAEVDYFVSDSGAVLLVCDGANLDALAPVVAVSGARIETLDPDGTGTFAALSDGMVPSAGVTDRGDDDLAAFLYTSGTTGRSKGAMLSQKNLISNARTLVDLWKFTSDDQLLHALPIFHTHGLFVAINTVLLTGGSMRFIESFSTDALIDSMPTATTMMGVPTFYTRLLDDPRFTKDLAKNMRLFISGSAPLLAETHRAFTERTGHHILERYGMTETNMSTSNPYDGARKPGTVGLPLPDVDLKITDPETGALVAQGEVGQIEVRGPNVFQGYWQMPEKTAAELRPDGFFITGDLATQDKDGYVTIVGRAKDLIIAGGYNIYPKEVEAALDEEDCVLESAVISVPHADLGEAVVAVVVPESGVAIDADALKNALSDKLAKFKQPRKIIVLPELPRNTMGKVQKAEMRRIFADLFDS
ncbi:malonate--CoA ligase [Cognatiyoonia sp.]|uniref:malonate--CoA ligase n=1 Tax=Cognatiyoonia sp. TaxID=2211652 RepID=UPI003F69E989